MNIHIFSKMPRLLGAVLAGIETVVRFCKISSITEDVASVSL